MRENRRTVVGKVASAKMQKTVVVTVHRLELHPKYKKYVRQSRKVHAHDEAQQAAVGDVVELGSMRPMSKLKRWRLIRVVEAATDRGVSVAAASGADVADVAGGVS